MRHHRDILHANRRSALGRDNCVFDVAYGSHQAHFADVDLLQPGLDEAAARIGIVIGKLLLDLGDAQSIGHEFIGIDAYLVLARRAAEA